MPPAKGAGPLAAKDAKGATAMQPLSCVSNLGASSKATLLKKDTEIKHVLVGFIV